MEIKFKRLHELAKIPELATVGSACADLYITEIETLINKVTVKLGFATEIPIGFKCCIVPRSSFSHCGWVMANSPGQIDSDYRGEWMVKFEGIPYSTNKSYGFFTPAPFPYKVGDRVAQVYLEEVKRLTFIEVDELSNTVRGSGGFGSTGKA